MDFRGFDSSVIIILRGGIPRPIGDFPESLSQAMLVGTVLVGRLGVPRILIVPTIQVIRVVPIMLTVIIILMIGTTCLTPGLGVLCICVYIYIYMHTCVNV